LILIHKGVIIIVTVTVIAEQQCNCNWTNYNWPVSGCSSIWCHFGHYLVYFEL